MSESQTWSHHGIVRIGLAPRPISVVRWTVRCELEEAQLSPQECCYCRPACVLS